MNLNFTSRSNPNLKRSRSVSSNVGNATTKKKKIVYNNMKEEKEDSS